MTMGSNLDLASAQQLPGVNNTIETCFKDLGLQSDLGERLPTTHSRGISPVVVKN